MLPGPLMMYQFQRSFIKAASRFCFCHGIKKRIDFSIAKNSQHPKISIVLSNPLYSACKPHTYMLMRLTQNKNETSWDF